MRKAAMKIEQFIGIDPGEKNTSMVRYLTAHPNELVHKSDTWQKCYPLLKSAMELYQERTLIFIEDVVYFGTVRSAAQANSYTFIKQIIAVLQDRYGERTVQPIVPKIWKEHILGVNEKPIFKDLIPHLKSRGINYNEETTEANQNDLDAICILFTGMDRYYDRIFST